MQAKHICNKCWVAIRSTNNGCRFVSVFYLRRHLQILRWLYCRWIMGNGPCYKKDVDESWYLYFISVNNSKILIVEKWSAASISFQFHIRPNWAENTPTQTPLTNQLFVFPFHHSSILPTRLMCCIKAIFLPILWKLWKISIISMENKWSACLVHILWVPHFNHIQQKIRAHSWNNARYTNTTIINHVFPFSKHLLPHWSQSVTKLDRELPKQWHISTVGYSEVFFFGLLLIAQECERVRTQRAVAIHRPSYPSHSYFRQLRD